jgi:hypothetical protein
LTVIIINNELSLLIGHGTARENDALAEPYFEDVSLGRYLPDTRECQTFFSASQ